MKKYHAELRRVYQITFENLNTESIISKEIMLQMIVKAIKDTVKFGDLMLILLISGIYPRMHLMNFLIPSIIQRAMTIEKVMIEIKKFRAERQIVNALNTRNDLIIISSHDLFLNSNVLVWRESNVSQRDKWIESFNLLDIENQTCKIALSFESTDFRSTVMKSFLIKSINDVESINENVQFIEDVQSLNHQNNSSTEFLTRSTRARRLSLKYQNFADIIIFLQDDDSLSNQFESFSFSTLIFTKSRRKEINDLLKKRVFELIIIEVVLRDVRIFNFRFVNEIKHLDTTKTYEKSRLVVQIYNDHDKTLMLTQSFIIRRISQRIILALTIIIKHNLYLRDIIQAY